MSRPVAAIGTAARPRGVGLLLRSSVAAGGRLRSLRKSNDPGEPGQEVPDEQRQPDRSAHPGSGAPDDGRLGPLGLRAADRGRPGRRRVRRKRDPPYVDVSTFDRQAAACAEYLTKGRQVAVSGRLVYREWTADDDSKRSKHSVIGRVEFLGGSRRARRRTGRTPSPSRRRSSVRPTRTSSSESMPGTSLRHGGALRGPADAGKEPLAIAGWLFPGGGAARPPVVEDPFWRSREARHSLSDVIAGQAKHVQAQLLAAHAAAIGEIVREAAARKAAGESPRALVAAASRLLRELIGQA